MRRLLAVLLFCLACGDDRADRLERFSLYVPVGDPPPAPERPLLTSHGAQFWWLSLKPAPSPERFARLVDASVAKWGGGENALSGFTAILADGDGHGRTFWGTDTQIIYVSIAAEMAHCPEVSNIAHEIGHAIIRDPNHTSPAWDEGWGDFYDAHIAPECGPDYRSLFVSWMVDGT